MDWKGLISKVWKKLSVGSLKAFRGLLCEKKDGEWELSKGNVAFWIVLSHCMYVWSGKATLKAAESVTSVAIDTASSEGSELATTAGEAVAQSGFIDSVANIIGVGGLGTGVPEQEFILLLSLLGYATIKTTKGGLSNALGAIRGKNN